MACKRPQSKKDVIRDPADLSKDPFIRNSQIVAAALQGVNLGVELVDTQPGDAFGDIKKPRARRGTGKKGWERFKDLAHDHPIKVARRDATRRCMARKREKLAQNPQSVETKNQKKLNAGYTQKWRDKKQNDTASDRERDQKTRKSKDERSKFIMMFIEDYGPDAAEAFFIHHEHDAVQLHETDMDDYNRIFINNPALANQSPEHLRAITARMVRNRIVKWDASDDSAGESGPSLRKKGGREDVDSEHGHDAEDRSGQVKRGRKSRRGGSGDNEEHQAGDQNDTHADQDNREERRSGRPRRGGKGRGERERSEVDHGQVDKDEEEEYGSSRLRPRRSRGGRESNDDDMEHEDDELDSQSELTEDVQDTPPVSSDPDDPDDMFRSTSLRLKMPLQRPASPTPKLTLKIPNFKQKSICLNSSLPSRPGSSPSTSQSLHLPDMHQARRTRHGKRTASLPPLERPKKAQRTNESLDGRESQDIGSPLFLPAGSEEPLDLAFQQESTSSGEGEPEPAGPPHVELLSKKAAKKRFFSKLPYTEDPVVHFRQAAVELDLQTSNFVRGHEQFLLWIWFGLLGYACNKNQVDSKQVQQARMECAPPILHYAWAYDVTADWWERTELKVRARWIWRVVESLRTYRKDEEILDAWRVAIAPRHWQLRQHKGWDVQHDPPYLLFRVHFPRATGRVLRILAVLSIVHPILFAVEDSGSPEHANAHQEFRAALQNQDVFQNLPEIPWNEVKMAGTNWFACLREQKQFESWKRYLNNLWSWVDTGLISVENSGVEDGSAMRDALVVFWRKAEAVLAVCGENLAVGR